MSSRSSRFPILDFSSVGCEAGSDPTTQSSNLSVRSSDQELVSQVKFELSSAQVDYSLQQTLPALASNILSFMHGPTMDSEHYRSLRTETEAELGLLDLELTKLNLQTSLVDQRQYGVKAINLQLEAAIQLTKEEINKIIDENFKLKDDVDKENQKLQDETTEYRKKKTEMDEFKVKVHEAESTSPWRQELQQQQQQLKQLQDTKVSLLSQEDELSQKIREYGDGWQLKVTALDLQIEERKVKLNGLSSLTAKVKQDSEILQKKNAAQLLRLKRQVQDLQTRDQQWRHLVNNLETETRQLEKELSEQ